MKRFFFSKRKKRNRPGRSRGSVESRIKRKHLEKELGMSSTSFSKSYATVKNPYPLKPRPEFLRYMDPWYDLATLCQRQEDLLTDKVDSATRIYGVVAALMCSLSAALLAIDFPTVCNEDHSGDGHSLPHTHHSNALQGALVRSRTRRDDNNAQTQQETPVLRRRNSFIEHVIDYENHAAGTSLLVSWGVPPSSLQNSYAGCCALSFYASLTATGLSGILNAWLAATPPGGISAFVKSNSKIIVLIPACLGISTVSCGTALFLGLDRSKGTPMSYFGLGGTLMGCGLMSVATIRGWNTTHRLIRKLAQKLEKRNAVTFANRQDG